MFFLCPLALEIPFYVALSLLVTLVIIFVFSWVAGGFLGKSSCQKNKAFCFAEELLFRDLFELLLFFSHFLFFLLNYIQKKNLSFFVPLLSQIFFVMSHLFE